MRITKPDPERADEWLLEVRWLTSQGAFASSAYDPENLTVADLVGCWLEDEVRQGVRAVTFVQHEKSYRLRVSPAPLGSITLSKLSVANCQAWRARMAREGVSASEQGIVIRLLRRALEQALAWEMITKNPAAHIKAPRYRPKEAPYVRAEEVPCYLEAMRGDPYEALYVVAILGGPSPSELRALKWKDFDEATGTIIIDESVSHLAGGKLDWNVPKSELLQWAAA